MKILLIRHAEPDYANDSLTPKGKTEAKLLAKHLGRLKNVVGIYSSPLGRAMQTAGPSAEQLGLPITVLPWLQEFRGRILDPESGKERIPWDLKHQFWQNAPSLLQENQWTTHSLMNTATPSVQEVYEETCQGIVQLLETHGFILQENRMFQCEENKEEIILVFCHMALAMAIIGFLTQVSPFALWHGFCMPPSSVASLVTEERQKGLVSFRCFQMGDTSHLAVENEPPSRMAMFQEIFTGEDHTNTT